MIAGVGIDLIQCRRVERELTSGPWQGGEGIFTMQEVTHCERGKRPAQRYAACFAAKEAALKALGAEAADLSLFREVEVLYAANARPSIALHSRLRWRAQSLGVKYIWLSIASGKRHAGALVVAEC